MPFSNDRSTQNYDPSTQCYGIPKKAADVWVSEIWAGHAAALDRRAVAKLDLAGAPDSDGGEAYTNAEIDEIRALLEKSATLDEQIASRLELREVNP